MPRNTGDEEFGTGSVETLSTRHGPKGRSILGEIEAHWRELRARSSHLPHRADLDASRIPGALPHAFLLERVAPGIARIRIAGQALSDLLGTEARGLPLSVFFAPSSRDVLRRWTERCFEAPAIVDLPIQAQQWGLRAPLTGRLLLLPMLDRNGEVTRAVGGLFVDGRKRTSIVKFELADAPARYEPIPRAEHRVIALASSAPAYGMAEAGRPYLRLVVNNG